MTVKENQRQLYTDLALVFSSLPDPAHPFRTLRHTSKGHGRLETRTLWATTAVTDYLDWPGVEQALCLERRVIHLATGEISTKRVYGVTSLRPDQLDLAHLLAFWRGHWSIENRLHWVKDVVLNEDACRVHTGQAPLILAMLRNALISFLHALGFESIRLARRHFALNLDEALAFVCGPLD